MIILLCQRYWTVVWYLFFLFDLAVRKGGSMVVIQVLSHNAVIAQETDQKGEWVLVQRGIGYGKKRGDNVTTEHAQRYRKIE